MSRLIKIVDNKYVQIEEYRNPNICFNTNEYNDFEDYCTLREIFNPFEMFYENEILKENAENNDKVVDKINWDNQLLKKENKKLKDNWNKLKEYIRKNIIYDDVGMKILDPSPLEDYMQELQESDKNQ